MGASEQISSGVRNSFFVFNPEGRPVEQNTIPFTEGPQQDRVQRTVDRIAVIVNNEIFSRARTQSLQNRSNKDLFYLNKEGFGPVLAKLENALVSYFFHSKELPALISENTSFLESETFHKLKKELGLKHGAKTENLINQILEKDSGRGILSMLHYLKTRTETLKTVCSSMEQKIEMREKQCLRYAISYNNDLDARYEVDAIETVYLLSEPDSSAIQKIVLCNLVQVKSEGFLTRNNLEISEEERSEKIAKIQSAHQALLDQGFLPYDEIVRRKEMCEFETSRKIVNDKSEYAKQIIPIIESILPNTPDKKNVNVSVAHSLIQEEYPSSPEEKVLFLKMLLRLLKECQMEEKKQAEKKQDETNFNNVRFLELLLEEIRQESLEAKKNAESQKKGKIFSLSKFGSHVYVGNKKVGSKDLQPKENKETGLVHRFPAMG